MLQSRSLLGRPIGAAFICAALLLFVMACFGLSSKAYAQSSSKLQGQVFNGTALAPAGALAHLDITLFQMGVTGPVTRTVQTDGQGRFTFADLKLDTSSPYFALVDYEGIHYFSDVLTPGVETSAPISLTVYETQTMPADFQIDRAHFILDHDQNALTGIELLQVKAPADRAFVLPIPLPHDLSGLQFNDPRDQFRAIQGTDGSLSFPILPTTDQILIGVRVTTTPSTYTLRVDVPVRIAQLNILVSQSGGVQVASPVLANGPVFSPQAGSSYSQLNGNDIPAGTVVPVAISNLPGGDNSTTVRRVVLGLGGLLGIALLSMPFIRRRGLRRPAPSRETAPSLSVQVHETASATTADRLERLTAIAELDEQFESGAVPQAEYRARRARLKSELMHDSDPET